MTEDDLIPEEIIKRRGFQFRRDSRGRISEAWQSSPLLIDKLLEKRIISYDNHFYGVQMLTMRKVFLSPVMARVGMLRIRHEDDAPGGKPIPIEDADYLKVLRFMRNNFAREVVLAICDEGADPLHVNRFATHGTGLAFDELEEAIMRLWERKKCTSMCGDSCVGLCR